MGIVIGIFSSKGGVGKTLLATNLAVAVGVGHHRKTILLDLNYICSSFCNDDIIYCQSGGCVIII